MSTVAEVIQRALTRLHVLQAGETVNAQDQAEGVIAYNGMMFGFSADGMDLHDASDVAYTHATQTAAGTFPLSDKHFESVAVILAMKMADTFSSGGLTPTLAADFSEAKQRLYADFLDIAPATLSRALTNLPSQTAADGGF